MIRRRRFTTILAAAGLLLLSAGPPGAQAPDRADAGVAAARSADAAAAGGTALSETQLANLRAIKDKIEGDDDTIRFLTARLAQTQGLIAEVTQARLDMVTEERYDSLLKLSKLVADHADAGRNVDDYMLWVRNELPRLPKAVLSTLDRVTNSIVYPDENLNTLELIAADQQLFSLVEDVDDAYGLLVEYLAMSERLGISDGDERDAVVVRLGDAAANRSAFLDISLRTAENLKASLAILPGNEDLLGRQNAADARVRLIAASLKRISGYMATLGLNVSLYRQQVLTATGEITTDVLDLGVVTLLLREWSAMLRSIAFEEGPRLIFKLLLLVLIIYVFVRVSRLVENVTHRALDSSKVHASHLLRRMVVSTGRNLVVLIGILIGLSQIGISLGPLLAGLGIAGFIIGFAMQDSLANFASGMLILLYRPFDVGDVVEAGGVSGKVQALNLVNATIMTFDNQTLIVPNNTIWKSVIKNVTAQQTRRVDLTFGIAYSADIETAEKVFRDACEAHEKVLQEPQPAIRLHELADSSVNFIVRPWVKTDDYWVVYWDLMRDIKLRLDEAGIAIPFPQRDIHIIDQQPA